MSRITITWHSMHDDRVCKICQLLDGYTWVFDTELGVQMSNALIHPTLGVVWTTEEGSKAHGHNDFNCRCTLTANFDLSNFLAKIQKIYSELQVGMI